MHELSVTSVHVQKKWRSWHPKRSHGTQHFKKMLLTIAYFYCQTQKSYNYSVQNTLFLLISHIWSMGPQHFFPGHFFLRQKCLRVQTESFFLGLHTFPLRRKKSAATAKIPSVRHFQDLKSILGGRYREKSAPQADFFFGGGKFFFFPHPKT